MTLTLMSLFHWGVAISIPLQVMWIYGYSPLEFEGIVSKLTVLNWAVMVSATLCGMWIAQASHMALKAVPVVIGLVALNNYVVGSYAIDYTFEQTAVATIFFVLVNVPMFLPKLQIVLRHPSRQWWRTPARQKIRLPILVGASSHPQLLTETFDLSETGVFIPLTEKVKTRGQAFNPAERLRLNFSLGALSQVTCEAVVVRKQAARGQYPAGFGIRFTKMPLHQRRALKRYLELYAQL